MIERKGALGMWYVVKTAVGQEKKAIEKCRNAIPVSVVTEMFSPTYEYMRRYQGTWHTIVGVLFPGYVFMESDAKEKLEEYLERIPDVVSPVCIGGGFYPISKEEEEFMRSLFDDTYCIRYSLGYLVDKELIVEKGPLRGKSQYVTRIDRHMRCADITLYLFQKERKVQVGLEVPARMTAREYEERKEAVKTG